MKAKILALIVIVLIIVGGVAIYQFRLFNRPPKAGFEIKPKYINPTDETTIKFINRSTDPDNDPLGYTWLVDERQVNTTRDHWTRLPVGNHTVRLVVYDGKVSGSMEKSVSVDRSWVYPLRTLKAPIKGINYETGIKWSDEWPSTSRHLTSEQLTRELDIARNELGCNAIRIFGDNNEELLKAAQLACNRFKEILVSPRYIDAEINATITRLCEVAKNLETLRKNSNSTIVLVIGNESTIDTTGILNSPTYQERVKELHDGWDYQTKKKWDHALNNFLRRAILDIRKVFGGRTTYCKGVWEAVSWEESGLDIIGLNEYVGLSWEDYTPASIVKRIKSLRSIGRPVYITEFGAATFKDAMIYGGAGYIYGSNRSCDQEAQARAIETHLEIFNEVGVDGCFLYTFIEEKAGDWDSTSFGIMKFEDPGPPRRKLGFYMYKSYVLANTSSAAKAWPEGDLVIPSALLGPFSWFTEAAMTARSTGPNFKRRQVKARS